MAQPEHIEAIEKRLWSAADTLRAKATTTPAKNISCCSWVTEYIEIFYNRQRKQERLSYLSPAEFKQRYYTDLIAA
jgi:hypothetical protein